jgi:DNA-directed RNA polymerase subunit M/transcription elongation factor TFIIS
MITSHSVSKTANGLLITMKGEGDKYFTCEAYLDLSENNQLKLHDLKIEEKKEETEVKEEQKPGEETKEEKKEEKEENKDVATTSNLPVTPSVKQFPINLEKTMTYNSSRGGYSMIFPSSNISYTSDAVNEDFNQV